MRINSQVQRRLMITEGSAIEYQGLRHVALGVCFAVLAVWCGGLFGVTMLSSPIIGYTISALGVVSYWAVGNWYAERYGDPPGAYPEKLKEKLPWYVAAPTFILPSFSDESTTFLLTTLVLYLAAVVVMGYLVFLLMHKRKLFAHCMALFGLMTAGVLVEKATEGEAYSSSMGLLVLGAGFVIYGIRAHREFVEAFGKGQNDGEG